MMLYHFLLCVVTVALVKPAEGQANQVLQWQCNRPEGEFCKSKTESDCLKKKLLPCQCPRLCGRCGPSAEVCPKEYPFGCCSNGEKAADKEKSNCRSKREESSNKIPRGFGATKCKRQEDKICKKRTKADCLKMQYAACQCPRLCGSCAPFVGVCPKEYPYGCCWDGTEARDIEKSNCKRCRDINRRYCARPAVKRDCDLQENSQATRALCPETCNACNDFGN